MALVRTLFCINKLWLREFGSSRIVNGEDLWYNSACRNGFCGFTVKTGVAAIKQLGCDRQAISQTAGAQLLWSTTCTCGLLILVTIQVTASHVILFFHTWSHFFSLCGGACLFISFICNWL
jgi:hypothetical protein